MKKTKIKTISPVVVINCAVLLLVFGRKKAQESPTVDNTGANTVSDYNTETANYQLSVDASKKIHDISNLLFGIFFALSGNFKVAFIAKENVYLLLYLSFTNYCFCDIL